MTIGGKLKRAYNTGKILAIGVPFAALVGFTLWKGISLYNYFLGSGTFERAAEAYFIGSDKSQKKIKKEAEKLENHIDDVKSLRKDLDDLRQREQETLEDRIKEFNEKGEKEKAEKLTKLKQGIQENDARLKETYDKAQEKLEDITKVPDKLAKYSTLWRRTVKVETYLVYEFITYARQKSKERKEAGGTMGKLQEAFEGIGRMWLGALGKTPEDSENKYKELTQRIRMYSSAELGKQGIANLIEDLNKQLENKNLSKGEKEMYELLRDSIRETEDTKVASQILDYLEKGKVPADIDKTAQKYLNENVESQKELLGLIDTYHKLVMDRYDIVVQAEETGIELEQGNFEMLEELTKKADVIVENLEKSDAELKKIGVNPRDPEFLDLVDHYKNLYLGVLAGLCLLEAAAAYYVMRNSLNKRKYYKAQDKIKELDARVKKLEGEKNA